MDLEAIVEPSCLVLSTFVSLFDILCIECCYYLIAPVDF